MGGRRDTYTGDLYINITEARRRSAQARQAKAAARRAKVKALREKGLSGPQIATELDINVRTIRHDFSILNEELIEEMERAFKRGEHRLGCELEQKLLKWTRGRMPKEK